MCVCVCVHTHTHTHTSEMPSEFLTIRFFPQNMRVLHVTFANIKCMDKMSTKIFPVSTVNKKTLLSHTIHAILFRI